MSQSKGRAHRRTNRPSMPYRIPRWASTVGATRRCCTSLRTRGSTMRRHSLPPQGTAEFAAPSPEHETAPVQSLGPRGRVSRGEQGAFLRRRRNLVLTKGVYESGRYSSRKKHGLARGCRVIAGRPKGRPAGGQRAARVSEGGSVFV